MSDPVNTALSFDWSKTRAYAKLHGLVFLENLATFADMRSKQAALTQAQVDIVGISWCDVVCTTFNPAKYKWWQRVMIAAFWLGNRQNPIK